MAADPNAATEMEIVLYTGLSNGNAATVTAMETATTTGTQLMFPTPNHQLLWPPLQLLLLPLLQLPPEIIPTLIPDDDREATTTQPK